MNKKQLFQKMKKQTNNNKKTSVQIKKSRIQGVQ